MMKNKILWGFLIAVLMSYPSKNFAYASWSLSWSHAYTSNPVSANDADQRGSYSSLLSIITQFTSRLQLQSILGFGQAFTPKTEFSLINPEFRLFYKLNPQANHWNFSLSPTVTLPINQTAKEESLLFAAGGALRASYSMDTKTYTGWSFMYDLGLNRNIHQYQTSSDGTINQAWALTHHANLSYQTQGNFAFSGWVQYSTQWDYLDTPHSKYELGQEVSYQPISFLEFSLSHRYGSNVLSPNGQDYQFGIYDSRTSRFTLKTTLIF